jgi:hypothetical protein
MFNFIRINCNKCGQVMGKKQHHCPTENTASHFGKHAIKGATPWNKGKTNIYSLETKKKMSLARKGKKLSPETCRRMSVFHKGKPLSIENRINISKTHKQRVLDGKCHLYKGGITKKHLLIRSSLEYKLWRKAVYERDKYTCVLCGEFGKNNLEADHIKPFSLFPELVFDVNNGRTLCIDCHKQTDTYALKVRKYKRIDFMFM